MSSRVPLPPPKKKEDSGCSCVCQITFGLEEHHQFFEVYTLHNFLACNTTCSTPRITGFLRTPEKINWSNLVTTVTKLYVCKFLLNKFKEDGSQSFLIVTSLMTSLASPVFLLHAKPDFRCSHNFTGCYGKPLTDRPPSKDNITIPLRSFVNFNGAYYS